MEMLATKLYIKAGIYVRSRIEKVKCENGNALIVGIIAMVIFIAGSIALNTPIGDWIKTTSDSVMTWGTKEVKKVIE